MERSTVYNESPQTIIRNLVPEGTHKDIEETVRTSGLGRTTMQIRETIIVNTTVSPLMTVTGEQSENTLVSYDSVPTLTLRYRRYKDRRIIVLVVRALLTTEITETGYIF